MKPRPLLVFRPEPGNAATLAAAKALALPAYGEPLFRIVPRAWEGPAATGFDALLIGSANVLRHGGAKLGAYASLPAYVVGEATADAARHGGFQVKAIGSGGLQNLTAQLARDGRRRVLRLAGDEHVPLSPEPGTVVETVVVYQAEPLALSEAGARLLGEGAVVLLHSAAAARHFASECGRLRIACDNIDLACLGPRIAEAAGSGWASVASAARPDDGALLALAARMCQTARFGETDAKKRNAG
ncbi:uroporphyrinogen-III synthase [Novosphingobium sp. Gsoil 351]|uniref:uroporphyrinogen-III synthase n=1 Tax=Novosphingobium sp. Gsoil 351 TaxID=2675225 RepID=UPI0012B4D7FC|nr:uroporphyrinogen-III synthase [Novosphingobium sp. Gsoil 351]QGN56187.1 uroporphyrinogen-III synthase [Novosphingobium sp. Gsoil 351]